MRPLKLRMEAFGSYGKETVIDFTRPSQELFLITGDTGSGKSTIFEAIVFALYGAPDRDKRLKSGLDFQSRFVRDGAEPYAELTFTELTGGEELTYTVRRTPRHRVRKKRGDGFKDVSETLSLIMPDGSEYPQKETQEKITEIVGLTREQFMQVAMIAQGEFRELISSDTPRRKSIFRKLFGTEIFDRIVGELDSRRKLLEAEMEKIQEVCRTHVSMIVLPPEVQEDEDNRIKVLRDSIVSSKRLSITDLEELTGAMSTYCEELSGELGELEKNATQKEKERDRIRESFAKGEQLVKAFVSAEAAERELKECTAAVPVIKEYEKQRKAITDSYSVKTKYTSYERAAKDAEETKQKLDRLREELPALTEASEKAASEERAATAESEKELEACTKVRERTEKAVKAIRELKEAQEQFRQKTEALKTCSGLVAEAEKAIKEHELREKEWKERENALSDAGVRLVECGARRKSLITAREQYTAAAEAQKAAQQQEKKAASAKQAYLRARNEFEAANSEYSVIRSRFLDAQAGLLASELHDGEKCPVCGSREHPEPCVLKDEHRELTRETVEEKQAEVTALDEVQNKRSAESSSASELLEEKREQAAKQLSALLSATAELSGKQTEGMTAEQAGAELEALLAEAEKAYSEAEVNAGLLEKVREDLKNAGAEGEKLRENAKKASDNVNAARNACAAAEAAVKERESRIDYPTEAEAGAALAEAEKKRSEKEEKKKTAQSAASLAKTKADKAAAQIAQYQEQLPGLESRRDSLRTEYEQEMKEKDLAEFEWKDITEKHTIETAEQLTEKIDSHNRRIHAAEGALKSAKATVGDQEKPDMEALEEAKAKAEEEYLSAQQRCNACRDIYSRNSGVLASLAEKQEERRSTAENFSRTENLYKRLSGKMTDGRMDIETRVQRFYLARILDAANRRFREMSDGRFELGMTPEETAAKGSNTGLDLMVYDNVNGSEREIKTLSGGESFMAALALALGMADQIQESSAAVNLDIMFIDEGFGSLSDHARAQAIKVLRTMAGGSKLIGIISHVTELKQQIEDKLVVEKDSSGSHISWVIS